MTLGQETRWAYYTTLPSPHGAHDITHLVAVMTLWMTQLVVDATATSTGFITFTLQTPHNTDIVGLS